jgi:hypothetical protein
MEGGDRGPLSLSHLDDGGAMTHKLTIGLCIFLSGLWIQAPWPPSILYAEPLALQIVPDASPANSPRDQRTEVTIIQTDPSDPSDDAQQAFEESLSHSITSLVDAIQDNTGIISLNQSSGSYINQANIRTFYVAEDPQMVVEAGVDKSSMLDVAFFTESGVLEKRNHLLGSFRDNTVLVGINQSAGNLNQQANTAVVVIGGLAALSNAELKSTRATNGEIDEEPAMVLEDVIANSFAGSRGIFQVSQASGSVNIQENNLAVSYREFFFK